MLTLHKPITMKTAKNILQMKEGFAQRIPANYEMMAVRITPIEMIHFITAPPNVYLQEGGMAPLVRRTDITYNQNRKLRLINNMLNRIFVSDTMPMTYQDSVFVTHIMNKMGVTDAKEFVRQFWLIQNDMRNVKQLIALYKSERPMLKAFRKHQKEMLLYKEAQKESGDTQKREYWLHQSILERLHTGEIYSEMRDFTVAINGAESEIYTDEIQISEQAVSAWHILLNKLRNETLMESQILVYNHLNSYELGDTVLADENYEQVISDMVGAVLLNVLTRTYAVCLARQMQTEKNWYAITDFIYQAAQNTLSRFENCYNRFQRRKSGKAQYYETLQYYQNSEIHMLQRMFADQSVALFHMENQKIENTTALEYQYNTVSRHEINDGTQMNETLLMPADTINYRAISNINVDGSNVSYEEQIRQQLEIINRNNLERMERIQQISFQSPENQSQKNETLLMPADTINYHAISNINVDGSDVSYEEQIRQQLEIINRNNHERIEQIQKISFQNPENRSHKIDMERTREDILRVIKNPDEAALAHLHSENQGSVYNILQNQELRQVLGEETIRAFEEIKKLHEHNDSLTGIEDASIKAFDQLVHDVSTVQMMEQIRRINNKQYQEELESVQSVIHNDLETEYHKKYGISVINWEKTAGLVTNMKEHYESVRGLAQRSDETMEKNLKLFHRQVENRISEETVAELIKSSRQVPFHSTEVIENVRETDSVTENVNNSFRVIELQQKNDLEQMVAQNINRQLRELSEQVYTKLERRMDTERRRRGL